MKPCFAASNPTGVSGSGVCKDMLGFTKRLERGIQRLSNGLSSSKAGALIQVWMPEVSTRGRVLLSTEGLPFSISGVGDLLALFRCISCKYRFDSDPSYGDSMGAIGRVYHYGKPEMCLDVQEYDKNSYMRVSEAQICRIHSTLILPIFDEIENVPCAVVELSHHDKTVEFTNVIRLFTESLREVSLRTTDVSMDDWKLGLRKWPIEVCSVPSTSLEDSNMPKKHPDEQGISHQDSLGRAMQTGFGPVSDFVMNRGMDSLTSDDQSVDGLFNAGYPDFFLSDNTVKNNMLTVEASPRFPSGLSRCVSESGSANTTQFPETHSHDCMATAEAIAVCQASSPMAPEAQEDMQSDSPKEEEDSFSTKDDEDKDDDDDGTEAKKKENRLAGGAGKRLSYKDLEALFGHGLKDAAQRLGICPTTLKRACRRNGITRWPSRQISKLLKVWKQMGYKGEPPSWLLQNAISGNLRSENLAYILSAGLHVGLNPQRRECTTESSTKMTHNNLSLYCGSSHAADPNGALLLDEDITLKNVTHHGAFTAALHGTDDAVFGYHEDLREVHDNHTWHAGQMANVILHPSAYACHPETTVGSHAMSFRTDLDQSKQIECPTSFDLERTQRGGAGINLALSEFAQTMNTEELLMQPFHVPLGFEASQNLFH